jgi:hypothetical protein
MAPFSMMGADATGPFLVYRRGSRVLTLIDEEKKSRTVHYPYEWGSWQAAVFHSETPYLHYIFQVVELSRVSWTPG